LGDFGEDRLGLWDFTMVRAGLPKAGLPEALLAFAAARVFGRILVTSKPNPRFVLEKAVEDVTADFIAA
jgi:hypothetical protein